MRRLLWLVLLAIALPLRGSDAAFITAQVLGTARSDFTGLTGFRITNTSGTDIVITQLGRWVISGNSHTHALSIYTFGGTPTQAATVTVDTSGATAGQYLYGTLGSPYTLTTGSTCYIVSAETNGGDQFYNSNTSGTPHALIGTFVDAYQFAGSWNSTNTNNSLFGPVNFKYSSPLDNWTKSGNVYTTDGSQFSVISAVYDATAGDIVLIPAGTFTYGASSSSISINKAVTVIGAGASNTTINISASAPTFQSGAIHLSAGATFGNCTITQPGGASSTAIQADTANGWRITGVTYNSAATVGYFVYAGSYGLIDNCTIVGGSGSDEWIFARGPTDSWTTANSLGTANAVYMEDCTLTVNGYNDFNSNARGVVRFCTITAAIKIDAHGLTTNTPANGVRQTEAYNNTWTSSASNWTAIEIRGGTGMVFNNTAPNTSSARFYLTDYGYQGGPYANYDNVLMTPNNYPLGDQIGVGQYATVNATTIVSGQIYTIVTVGTTSYTSIGSPNNTVGTRFVATGSGSGTGTVTKCVAASEPVYLWGNLQNGSAWPRTFHTATAAEIAAYGSSFGDANVEISNRDFFSASGFDTNTGVSVGTTAQMNALTPSVTGYGFWVTDQGSWNSTLPANTSGSLYTWSGSAWASYYTPYAYPHPLRGALASNGMSGGASVTGKAVIH